MSIDALKKLNVSRDHVWVVGERNDALWYALIDMVGFPAWIRCVEMRVGRRGPRTQRLLGKHFDVDPDELLIVWVSPFNLEGSWLVWCYCTDDLRNHNIAKTNDNPRAKAPRGHNIYSTASGFAGSLAAEITKTPHELYL